MRSSWTTENYFRRVEVEKAIAKIKCGRAAGTDGITPEIMKYEGMQ